MKLKDILLIGCLWLALGLRAVATTVFNENFDGPAPYSDGGVIPVGFNTIQYGKWYKEINGGTVTASTAASFSPSRSLALTVAPDGLYALAWGTFGLNNSTTTPVSTPIVVRLKFRLSHTNGSGAEVTTVGVSGTGGSEKFQVRLGVNGRAHIQFAGSSQDIGGINPNTWYFLEILIPQLGPVGNPAPLCSVSLFSNNNGVRGTLMGTAYPYWNGPFVPHSGIKLVNRMKGSTAFFDDVVVESVSEDSLRPGPYAITDLGSPFSDATLQNSSVMFEDSNGDPHLLLHYVSVIWKNPFEMVDINLVSGSARRVSGVLGRPGPRATIYHQGKIYIASADPGYLFEYDVMSGNSRQIRQLAQRHAQCLSVGDDGWIYVGEVYGGGSLPPGSGGGIERFNPATDEWQNLGSMDPAFPGQQYASTVGADGRYVYVGLGQVPWYLAIYDLNTKSITYFWKAENDTAGTVHRAVGGGWYYQRRTSANVTKWYRLENGAAIEVPLSLVPPLVPWYESGNVISDAAQFLPTFGYEINLDDAHPCNFNNGSAVVRWKVASSSEWTSQVMVEGFTLEPSIIKRLVPIGNGRMLGAIDYYGPVFNFSSIDHSVELEGWTQANIYDILATSSNIYYSGYTAAFLQDDPLQPWTLSASNPAGPSTNPKQITFGPGVSGKYNFFLAEGADSHIYVGIHHERNSEGGAIGWYDPVSGATDKLRDLFLQDDVADLVAADEGRKILYSSKALTPGAVGRIFVFDTASKTVTHSWDSPAGYADAGKLIEVEPGKVVGVTEDRIYKMDYLTGALVYQMTLGGKAFGSSLRGYDRRLIMDPDGYLWLFIGNALHRVDPANGSAEHVLNAPASNLSFGGGNLYLFGIDPTIKVVKGLFWNR